MQKQAVIIGAVLGLAALLYLRQDNGQPASDAPDEYAPEPDLTASESLELWTAQTYYEIETMIRPATDASAITPNVRAFIDMISQCEGTANAGGYAALYGSRAGNVKTFNGFADHPRLAQRISGTDPRWTTAAGLLQWMAVSPIPGGGYTRLNTWDRLKAKLQLPDFSPASQDRAAVEVFEQFGALADIQAGRVLEAARKLRSQWASLPGAGYGQGERTTAYVSAKFAEAGGVLA